MAGADRGVYDCNFFSALFFCVSVCLYWDEEYFVAQQLRENTFKKSIFVFKNDVVNII